MTNGSRSNLYLGFWKPTLDRTLSLLVLLMASPLLLVGVLLSFADTRCNPFFVHPRPGHLGKTVMVLKLRTMQDEYDGRGNKRSNVDRISRIGNFLRRTSIDELPQLINVIKGELSLVGPRPLEMRYLPHYTAEQNRRHDVLPGITGLAQVSGRNRLSWDRKFELDIRYVDNISFKLDCEILFATALRIFKSDDVNSSADETMDPFV